MTSPLDILTGGAGTLIPGGGIVTGAVGSLLNDPLNPDQKAKLSAVLARNGWGAPNSTRNRMARAIIQRESNGDPNAQNPSGATGLFQVMTPLHCGKYGTPKPADECVKWLKDPDNNAKAAYAMFRTSGWQPWVSSGPVPPRPTNWDKEIITDKDTLTGGVAGVAGDVAGAVASPFAGIAGAATDLIGALLSKDTWFRIGKTWMGAVFIITGTGALVFIIANQASGGKVARVAKTTVTKGAL